MSKSGLRGLSDLAEQFGQGIGGGGGGNSLNLNTHGLGGLAAGYANSIRHWHKTKPDRIKLVSDDDSLIFDALLGAEPAVVNSGYGGWEEVPVPGRRARAVWRGPGVIGIQVTVLIDGFLRSTRATPRSMYGFGGHSVEPMCARLEAFAGVEKGFHADEPPECRIYGVAVPHNYHRNPSWRWVVSELEWTDPVIRERPSGKRRRQGATFTLWRVGEPDPLERLPRRRHHPKTRTIRSKKGDTFRKIAKRELGNAHLGGRLARFNHHKDPRKELPKHTLVRLPAGAKLKDWKDDLRHRRDGFGGASDTLRDLGRD